jgi:hypothetical protein
MLLIGEALARQIDHDGLPQLGHVVGKRRAQAGRKHIHRARGEAGLQQFHDTMAAHEIANPHVRHEQNRPPI